MMLFDETFFKSLSLKLQLQLQKDPPNLYSLLSNYFLDTQELNLEHFSVDY